ncbi:hypothetical protein I6F35_02985 [Bradyrhizobium sp. BRP22]|uniref:hypothetical protein n=1 Tax=Bradyrhizobium sp. BRP22 TaxID=2793821 RepID=UPI001CD2E8EA|nr:hypothetical protein [Bradyrhizobium sp. BRP22]MCA1452180.1 hypothetical protein [Bradyrhizobium sp. BRP22]
MPVMTQQDHDHELLIELTDDIGEVLERLPDDTPVAVILGAFGGNIQRVMNVVVSTDAKRQLFDWFIGQLHENIGSTIAAPGHFNGDST